MAAYTIKPLVTATATNTGGRNGHSETTDHSVSVDLSVRKEMGGPGLDLTDFLNQRDRDYCIGTISSRW